ncbi:uncharacterized protein LY79DRAFT_669655 [Colletotrichum navitas]|uniref:Uncharacterized protein n=1 Tax=Colletotrichum navitas TaxID=681940 RepID=A0AAD8PZ86_9PEZI|nr:uncharacterized protein LY79DRAFT_669655 [Colletotrichum navitas]KAK1590666.1 hypothetical protein LY79DRAFT_669655 [Colletotrichum navitas]
MDHPTIARARETIAYKLLFAPEDLPSGFIPSFDLVAGNKPYRSQSMEELREEIETFTDCEDMGLDCLRGWGVKAFARETFPGFDVDLILNLERHLNFNRDGNNEKDPLHEVLSEQDTAVAILTHYIQPAHKMLNYFNPPGPLTQCRATWEAGISPEGRSYFNTKRQQRVQLSLRADIAYGLKHHQVNLDFGAGEPGLQSRPIASIEFKRTGLLKKFAQDLKNPDAPRDDGQRFEPNSIQLLKQVVGYCFAFRTKFAATSDLDYLVFFSFDRMTIDEMSTPVDVWEKGHGGTFQFAILGPTEATYKIACYAGFLRMAAEKTPKDLSSS